MLCGLFPRYRQLCLWLWTTSVAAGFISRSHLRSKFRFRVSPLPSSLNPSDSETPEERQQRMEAVRRIQKSFYQDEAGITKDASGVFEDVPLWRVQWTELPGYQNVLHIHVAHYTHMFQKVLNGPQPWYFGHVYLPGGSENLDNPAFRLCTPSSKATHTGALMKVADYQQLDDGRLLIIAQALGRLKVVEVTQNEPYAVATVELTPDQELIESHFHVANVSAAAKGLGDDDVWEAARAIAVAESLYWESFEFRRVLVDECTGGGSGVSPVANFDAEASLRDPWDVSAVVKEYLRHPRKRTTTACPPVYCVSSNNAEKVFKLECEVWVALDLMIQLLSSVNPIPNQGIPVPTQILGLLPKEQNWPEDFKLDTYVSRLSLEKAVVGTLSKSPFVVVDDAAKLYPKLRRAQRLSYAIWCLLETVLVGYDPAAQTRQALLELETISERLGAAKRGLDSINQALRKASEHQ